MKRDTLERAVLDIGVDDFCGPWEIIPIVQETDKTESTEIAERVAKTVLKRLLTAGLVRLYLGTRFRGEQRELGVNEASAAVERPEYWRSDLPTATPHVRFAATAKGESAYNPWTQH